MISSERLAGQRKRCCLLNNVREEKGVDLIRRYGEWYTPMWQYGILGVLSPPRLKLIRISNYQRDVVGLFRSFSNLLVRSIVGMPLKSRAQLVLDDDKDPTSLHFSSYLALFIVFPDSEECSIVHFVLSLSQNDPS